MTAANAPQCHCSSDTADCSRSERPPAEAGCPVPACQWDAVGLSSSLALPLSRLPSKAWRLDKTQNTERAGSRALLSATEVAQRVSKQKQLLIRLTEDHRELRRPISTREAGCRLRSLSPSGGQRSGKRRGDWAAPAPVRLAPKSAADSALRWNMIGDRTYLRVRSVQFVFMMRRQPLKTLLEKRMLEKWFCVRSG